MTILQWQWPHPHKKTKFHCGGVPHKAREVVKSDKDNYKIYNNNETIFAKAAKLLGNRDPLAIE
jgi:hypothetical protein